MNCPFTASGWIARNPDIQHNPCECRCEEDACALWIKESCAIRKIAEILMENQENV